MFLTLLNACWQSFKFSNLQSFFAGTIINTGLLSTIRLLYRPIILSATIKTFLVTTGTNLLTNGICGKHLRMRQAQNKSAYKHKNQSLHNILQKTVKNSHWR